jgi:hypothetical protein
MARKDFSSRQHNEPSVFDGGRQRWSPYPLSLIPHPSSLISILYLLSLSFIPILYPYPLFLSLSLSLSRPLSPVLPLFNFAQFWGRHDHAEAASSQGCVRFVVAAVGTKAALDQEKETPFVTVTIRQLKCFGLLVDSTGSFAVRVSVGDAEGITNLSESQVRIVYKNTTRQEQEQQQFCPCVCNRASNEKRESTDRTEKTDGPAPTLSDFSGVL